jgi:hypothetical protein
VSVAYLGDTLTFTDTLPGDLTGATVTLDVRDPSGNTTTTPATVDGNEATATFVPPTDEPAGTYGGMWRVLNAGATQSFPASPIVVVDPGCMWAYPSDVFAVIGPRDVTTTTEAIVAAQAILGAHFCTPIDCDAIPNSVRLATAMVAGRLMTRAEPGAQVLTSETIGDYTYRQSAPDRADVTDLVASVRNLTYPYLCGWARSEGTIKSPRVWPSELCCPSCGQWALPLLGGCGCDPLHEYQPDAEGFMRS